MKQLIDRYPIVFFFLLTYLLSWSSVPVANGGLLPHGPTLAAATLVVVMTGRQGISAFWRQLTQWRAGWWYLVGPLLILGYTGIAFIVSLLSGATLAQAPQFLSIGVLVQLMFFGGQWEEPGWTGYALPKMRERFAGYSYGALIAVLVLGFFRALWHLPLLLYGTIYWFDVFVFSFAYQIIIAWLYDRSGKSVPAVMVFHFVSNVVGAIASPVFAGADRLAFYALFMSLATLVALALVLVPQIGFGRKKLEVIGMDS